MSLASKLIGTATILRLAKTTGVDRYNNPNRIQQSNADVPAWVQQTDDQEITIGRETVISTHFGIFPAGTAIDPTDRVIWQGVTYEVLGRPAARDRPRRGDHHIEVRLRAVTG